MKLLSLKFIITMVKVSFLWCNRIFLQDTNFLVDKEMNMRLEVFLALCMIAGGLWGVTQCGGMNRYCQFGGNCYLCLQEN